MTPEEARERTDRLRARLEWDREEALALYAEMVWIPLGYDNWETYRQAEFPDLLPLLPRTQRPAESRELVAAGMTTREAAATLGVDHSTIVRDLKPSPGASAPDLSGSNGHLSSPPPTKAIPSRLGYVGTPPGQDDERDSDSWFTPTEVIEPIREYLGGIDFDPFSSHDANKTVQAGRYLTVDDDAFTCAWPTVETAFMNPPYGRGLIERAVDRWLRAWCDRQFVCGVALLPNRTDTQWFQDAADQADMVCLVRGRVQFWNVDGKSTSSNTAGSALLVYCALPNVAPLRKVGLLLTVGAP